jgi:hypothetical protein
MLNCWDENGDGALNRTELEYMIVGQQQGLDCPTANNIALTSAEESLFRSWIGRGQATFRRLYSAPNGRINKTAAINAMQGYSNLFIVGKTATG